MRDQIRTPQHHQAGPRANPAAPRRADLQIGLVPTGRRSVAELEALPIDSLWVGGHVASRNPSPEAMVGLAQLAARTERVRVGTAVLLLPLYPPAIVAKQVADLDRATGGRLVLGIGVGGEYPQEFRACGIPIEERGRRTDEIIPLLRRLWTADPVTHAGAYYAMEDVRIHPAPLQPDGPPIVVAGRAEAAMRRAATLGDGWFPYLYSPERYAASVTTVRSVAAEHGRDLAGFGWYAWVFVNVGDDGAAARADAARTLGLGYDQDLRAAIDRIAAAGTSAEVLARLRAFRAAGADHLVLCVATTGDPEVTVDRLVAEVLPELRVEP